MSLFPVEDPEHVDERCRAIGLGPLEEDTAWRREAVARSTEKPPRDRAARQREMLAWLRSVGWRD